MAPPAKPVTPPSRAPLQAPCQKSPPAARASSPPVMKPEIPPEMPPTPPWTKRCPIGELPTRPRALLAAGPNSPASHGADSAAQAAHNPAPGNLAEVDGVPGADLVDEIGSGAQTGADRNGRPNARRPAEDREPDAGDDGQGGAPFGRVGLAVSVELLGGDGVQARGVVQVHRVVARVGVGVGGPAGAGGRLDGVGGEE